MELIGGCHTAGLPTPKLTNEPSHGKISGPVLISWLLYTNTGVSGVFPGPELAINTTGMLQVVHVCIVESGSAVNCLQ